MQEFAAEVPNFWPTIGLEVTCNTSMANSCSLQIDQGFYIFTRSVFINFVCTFYTNSLNNKIDLEISSELALNQLAFGIKINLGSFLCTAIKISRIPCIGQFFLDLQHFPFAVCNPLSFMDTKLFEIPHKF